MVELFILIVFVPAVVPIPIAGNASKFCVFAVSIEIGPVLVAEPILI